VADAENRLPHSVEEPEPLTGWYGDHGSIWISPPEKRLSRQAFHKRRVGLREIAFRADSRAQIDELAKEIEPNGGKILDPPREYSYRPGYYSVFFSDPSGIKLEVVHY
jgi:catechol 2,3-dioxygenase-like lactoylglutathione lyase family enzyme